MSILAPTSGLSEPTGSNKISLGTLGYIRARIRQRAYNLVIRELKKSGITQADLARRLGKGQDAISRLLRRPRNWELDTLGDLLFAISGAVPAITVEHPLTARASATSHVKIDPNKPATGSDRPPLIPTTN